MCPTHASINNYYGSKQEYYCQHSRSGSVSSIIVYVTGGFTVVLHCCASLVVSGGFLFLLQIALTFGSIFITFTTTTKP